MTDRPSSDHQPVHILSLAAVVLALAAGCTGGGGDSSSESPRPGASAGRSSAATSGSTAPIATIDVSSCDDFGPAEAAALLGIAEEEIEAGTAVEEWGTTCTYVRRGDALYEDAVSFTLSRSPSAEEAAQDMAQLRGHVEIGDQVLASGQSHPVAELGDEALWVASNDSLYVRAGAVSIIVTLPKDEKRQIEVARALLD